MNTVLSGAARRHALVSHINSDSISPTQAFQKLGAQSTTAFLFESAQYDSNLAPLSIIGIDPVEIISIKNSNATICRRDGSKITTDQPSDTFSFLQERHELNSRHYSTEGLPEGLPFTGGLAGYIGYASVSGCEPVLLQSNDPLGVPDCLMAFFDTALVFDHLVRSIYLITYRDKAYAATLIEGLLQYEHLPPLTLDCHPLDLHDVQIAVSTEDYLRQVDICKANIIAGEVFQVVLSRRFYTSFQACPIDVYRILQTINPSPYSYLLKFPDFSYVGSSPETLVACRENRLSLRVLAGTIPRGRSPEEDRTACASLKSDAKELAEHYMLVDLGRNDLGRIAVPGTIELTEFANVAHYRNVMHLSSQVQAVLQENVSAFDVLKACFPAGTVSGAPKVRAMQLLSQLESEQRGIYSGMVGYVSLTGDIDGAIAIRSALIKDGVAHVHAGAGIVYDSVPQSECDETIHKASAVLHSIKLAKMQRAAHQCRS